MLYAVKPAAVPVRPPSLQREPTPEGGHDSDDMRHVLRTALRTFSSTPLPMSQLRAYADYLETMAFAGPARWFAAPSKLAWSWREYFELADRVEAQLHFQASDPEAEPARRVLVSAMTLLTSRVLAFASQEARQDPRALSVPLLATAARASSRTRRWCGASEPGKPQMMGVLSYSVIDVAAQAVERLTRDDTCTGELVRETTGALDEVLATLKQLAVQHSPSAYFDEGLGGHQVGQPSRAVRALQGLAWSHDVLGQAGLLPQQEQLEPLLGLLESLWQETQSRANERRGLVLTAAHLTSAWATMIEAGTTTSLHAANRCLWLARQASATVGGDLPLAQALLDVAQSVAGLAGGAVQKGNPKGVTVAVRTAELVHNVVRRCDASLPNEAWANAAENLSRVATEAHERNHPDAAKLTERLRLLATAPRAST